MDTANPSRAETSLAIGCFAAICRDRLADRLLTFARRCPEASVGVHEMPRAALLPALRGGTLALAVLPGTREAGLESVELWRDRVMVGVASGHPLAAREAVTPSELREQVLLVSTQHHGGDMHRFLSRRVLPLAPPHKSVLLNVGQAALMTRVAKGEGVALLCASHAGEEARGVALPPIAAPGAAFPVHAHWRDAAPGWPLSVLVDTLMEDRARV